MPPIDQKSRFRGALLGLAAGDALGTTLEFQPRDSEALITDLVGGGPFRLRPGDWTDDTSMALCLAESLIERNGFDALDQMERYCRWKREGHLSSTGSCFDIGNTIASALRRFESLQRSSSEALRDEAAFCGSTDPSQGGNGSLMRLAPVPLYFAQDAGEAIRLAGESSRTTHGAAEPVDACRWFAQLLLRALYGEPKDSILEYAWRGAPLAHRIEAIARGSYRAKKRDQIESSGYVVHTLEAALWAFHHGSDFREGALLAVNLGGDADTTGAVYGQLAGVYYGEEGIPEDWRAKLAMRELIEEFADRLHEGPI